MTTTERATGSPPRLEGHWFRRFGGTAEGHGGPLLICFPHAGGAASAYLPLSRALAPRVDVLAVQYPGRQDRRLETPAESLTALAETVAAELATGLGHGRPYALFGHSMGAALAYETARRLRGHGVPAPERLFLSGRGAPSPEPRQSDRVSGDTALVAEIRRLGGTGSRVLDEPELLGMVLPALRADYRALAGYRWTPGPALGVPFTVLVGEDDPVVPPGDAEGWLAHSTEAGAFLTFPGGHFYLDAHTERVAGVIASALAVPPPPG
ncbi:alpha/beta fold hydrolase [Streptomyces sp. NPDC005805]|uniref:thioesterase II family protein n=1 Tax=Streptomyces sp. NPDC005805 TaxID=3157068 RepID=UPI0033DA14D9